MTDIKYTLQDLITEWRNFERDNNPIKFAKKIQDLNNLDSNIAGYMQTYNLEVYQPIIKCYFNKSAELFDQYRKELRLD